MNKGIRIITRGKSHLFHLAQFFEDYQLLDLKIVLWPKFKFNGITKVRSYFILDQVLKLLIIPKPIFFDALFIRVNKIHIIDVNLLEYLSPTKMKSVIIDMPTLYWEYQDSQWSREELLTGIKIDRRKRTVQYLGNSKNHFENAAKIIVPSTSSLMTLPDYLRAKSVVIPFLGFDLDKSFKINFKNELEKIICIGIVCPSKGWHYTVFALNTIDRKFEINFYGSINDEYRKYLEDIASPNLILNFHGHINQDLLFEKIKKSDICIHSSVSEGLPLSILHCLKLGTPVFCSYDSNLNELLPPNFIYQTYDRNDFVKKFMLLPRNTVVNIDQKFLNKNRIKTLWKLHLKV